MKVFEGFLEMFDKVEWPNVREKKKGLLSLDKYDLNTEPAARPPSKIGSSFSKCVMPLSSRLELPQSHSYTRQWSLWTAVFIFSEYC